MPRRTPARTDSPPSILWVAIPGLAMMALMVPFVLEGFDMGSARALLFFAGLGSVATFFGLSHLRQRSDRPTPQVRTARRDR